MAKPKKLRVARIGNSRGVRIPADVLKRYQIDESVLLEERAEGILLRPLGKASRLTWEETAREMAASREDWSGWDATAGDGLEDLPWDARTRVAERRARYRSRSRAPQR